MNNFDFFVFITKRASDTGAIIYFNGSKGRTTTTTITVKNSETDEDEEVTVTVFYADNQRVYDAAGTITLDIVIPDEEAKTTSYSIAQYITAITETKPTENIDIAKALYEFGVSAKAYRDGRTDY